MLVSIAPSGSWPKAAIPCRLPPGHPLSGVTPLPAGVYFEGGRGFVVDRVKGREIEVGPRHLATPRDGARWGLASFTVPGPEMRITGWTIGDIDSDTPTIAPVTELRNPADGYAEATNAQLNAALNAAIAAILADRQAAADEAIVDARAEGFQLVKAKVGTAIAALVPPRRFPDDISPAQRAAVMAALESAGVIPPAP